MRAAAGLKSVLVVVALVPMLGHGSAARAHLGSHEVQVRNNVYLPEDLHIDPGETVTWTAIDGGHTVTADDGSFRFPGTGTLAAGDGAGWEAPNIDVTVPYGCQVHASMRGVITVGRGSPSPPPPPVSIEVRSVPSAQFPTVAAALAELPPRARIEIAPGTYPGPLIVSARGKPGIANDITIVGLGGDPSAVTITGGGISDTGIGVVTDGVHLENLTVTDFVATGVFVDVVTGFTIDRVAALGNGSFGINVLGRRGRIADSIVSGSSKAGISIQDCKTCDVLLQRTRAEGNAVGVMGTNAGGLVVRDSVFAGNGIAIMLESDPSRESPPQFGAHVQRNVIDASSPPPFPGRLGRSRAGVWIAGGWFNVIEENQITASDWGVLVTGLGLPVANNRIADNTLAGAATDLAWDGIGFETCFAGNRTQHGDGPSSEPPMIEHLYPCDRPTAGLPYPLVDVEALAAWLQSREDS